MPVIMPNIVIVRRRESIVVRSIEKRLHEMGLTLSTSEESVGDVKRLADKSDIFIVYIDDITDDLVQTMVYISDLVRENTCYMIIIGEKKLYYDLICLVPTIKNMVWLDRPVDMHQLADTIDEFIDALSQKREKKKVLIVDDDPSYAKMIREWLKDDYKLFVATAGMQALSFLMKQDVDLILLDYEMPVVDGPQILEMLRDDPSTANIPVIFLTGVQTKEEVARVLALQPKGYLLKSTSRDALLQYIGDFFEKMKAY